jgi:anti-sigma factor RsiW
VITLCDFQSRLSAYYDGELDLRTARDMSLHLAECESCRQELKAMRQVSGVLSCMKPRELSPLGLARLHRSADELAEKSDALPLAKVLMAMAASVMVIGAAWLVQSPGQKLNTPTPVVVVPTDNWERVATGGQVDFPKGAGGGDTGLALDSDAVNDWIRLSTK